MQAVSVPIFQEARNWPNRRVNQTGYLMLKNQPSAVAGVAGFLSTTTLDKMHRLLSRPLWPLTHHGL